MEITKFSFDIHGDHRGKLIALEAGAEIPFDIKRVYYMYDTVDGVRRGGHAHKQLKQVLICVHGNCKILLDNGKETQVVPLSSPEIGLYLESDMWREMYDFSQDAVLMVLASERYDESDYIRDYDEFLEMIENKGGHCHD